MSPEVSVIIAAWNASAFIERSVRSALSQTLANVEVIVVDDASTDDTAAMVENIASKDSRVRLLRLAANSGPAAARNAGLDAAAGKWIAILDSDDFMKPERLAVLVEHARARDLGIVVDDVARIPAHALSAAGERVMNVGRPHLVTAARFLQGNRITRGSRSLGFLQPLIDRSLIEAPRLRYEEGLRIGEDFHLVLELLALGARMGYYPAAMYSYVQRASSISKRLRVEDVSALLAADARFRARHRGRIGASAMRALNARRAELRALRDYMSAATAVKTGRFLEAARLITKRPAALRFGAFALSHRVSRLAGLSEGAAA